jgi:hypothetical protein
MAPQLLAHLQDPAAALGDHEFSDWPSEYIANGFGGDLDARYRHDHTRHAWPPVRARLSRHGSTDSQEATPHSQRGHRAHPIRTPYFPPGAADLRF